MFENQIDILKNYDIIDIISRIAALTLDYRNQNVSFMLNGLIDEITEHERSYYSSSIRMSDKKFRNIINSVSGIDEQKWTVDPCENLFTQQVIFYGNHTVFNGMDHEPAYQLQMVLNAFYIHKQEYRNLAEEFPVEYHKLIGTVLSLSDYIAEEVGDLINRQKELGDRSSEIFVPDGHIVREYAQLLTISGRKVRSVLDDENLFWDIMLEFNHAKSIETENRKIFSHPFLYDEINDRFIILDPGLLPQFLMYQYFMLADRAGIKHKVIADFNNTCFQDVSESLSKLGHKEIDAKERWNIDLICNDTYKEAIFSVGTNEYILLSFLGDNADEYGEDTIHKDPAVVVSDLEMNVHFSEISQVLQDQQHVDGRDIYHLISLNSIGRSLMFEFYQRNTVSDYDALSLTPFELWCISINENEHEYFIPRYIRAKSLVQKAAIPSLFSELDKVETYT